MLDPTDRFFSALVDIVAQRPGVKVKEIAQCLSEEHRIEVSLPTLYRRVSTCVSRQLFIKRSGRVSLNLVWASSIVRFANEISKQYLSPDVRMRDLPEREGDEEIFEADSLFGLDACWNHVLVALAKKFSAQTFVGYNARAWYALGMRDTELALYQALFDAGAKVSMLYGHRSFLDQYGLRICESAGLNTKIKEALGQSHRPELAHGIVWTVGDYSIEFVMPKALCQHFDFFFQHIDSISRFNAELFADVFSMKQKCQFVIRRDRQRAEVWREAFQAALSE